MPGATSSEARPPLRSFPDADALTAAAAETVLTLATHAIAARGVFHLVLAGGGTPKPLYRRLAAANADWPRWRLWFGDERCLPPDDPERNSRAAAEAFAPVLDALGPRWQPIAAERGAEAAARDYAQRLVAVPDFDLVLLGLGEDGHTASLFPSQDAGLRADAPDALPVHHAPKPPPDRVSLSAVRLSRARAVWFLVTGQAKRTALARWAAGEALPAARIHGREQTCIWATADAEPVPGPHA
jgi:6-phosphogluconolactonase (EC 3.1.1.31)